MENFRATIYFCTAVILPIIFAICLTLVIIFSPELGRNDIVNLCAGAAFFEIILIGGSLFGLLNEYFL